MPLACWVTEATHTPHPRTHAPLTHTHTHTHTHRERENVILTALPQQQ
jgi:hypothetical protein